MSQMGFDTVPLWALVPATIALVAVSIEGGYKIGQFRRRRSEQEKDAPVGAIVGGTFGLLAFMLAFTFGLAATHFNTRRQLVLQEADALGKTYLRAGLLPAHNRSESRKLLREYVDVRIVPIEPIAVKPGAPEQGLAKSVELHSALWSQASEALEAAPLSIAAKLFIESLNDVIDLHHERLAFRLHHGIPELVWFALYFVTVLAMTALGYQLGLSGSQRSLAAWALALAFATVMLLIADLDRPYQHLIHVSQRAMLDLRSTLDGYDSASSVLEERSQGA
jgi:hypothetical protein